MSSWAGKRREEKRRDKRSSPFHAQVHTHQPSYNPPHHHNEDRGGPSRGTQTLPISALSTSSSAQPGLLVASEDLRDSWRIGRSVRSLARFSGLEWAGIVVGGSEGRGSGALQQEGS